MCINRIKPAIDARSGSETGESRAADLPENQPQKRLAKDVLRPEAKARHVKLVWLFFAGDDSSLGSGKRPSNPIPKRMGTSARQSDMILMEGVGFPDILASARIYRDWFKPSDDARNSGAGLAKAGDQHLGGGADDSFPSTARRPEPRPSCIPFSHCRGSCPGKHRTMSSLYLSPI